MVTLLTTGVFIICGLIWLFWRPKHRLPPGPTGMPIIGILSELDTSKTHIQLADWASKYGPIYSFKALGTVTVVINDVTLVREAFASSKFSSALNDRPETFFGKYIVFNYSDVGYAMYDDATVKLRKAFHKGLHFYGDGVKRFEDLMTKELERLIAEIDGHDGDIVDPRSIIENSMCLLVCTLLLGKEMKAESDLTSKVIWEYLEILNVAMNPGVDTLLQKVPALRFLPSRLRQIYLEVIEKRDNILKTFYFDQKDIVINKQGYRILGVNPLHHEKFLDCFKLKEVAGDKFKYVEFRKCLPNEKSFDPKNQRGLVDVFFSLQYRDGEEYLTDDQVKGLVIDAIGAGMMTSSFGTVAMLLTLLNNTDCMDKIREEIDAVVGHDRLPEFKDRASCPYLEAAILEGLRYFSHFPLMPHSCKQDIEFAGYLIPKGAQIFANIWHIHHDPKLWQDSWTFKPERFLDESGQMIDAKHPTRLNGLMFGIGPRSCVGETLAKSRIFLYLATLIQRYDIMMTSDTPANPNLYKNGLILEPTPFKCRFIRRSQP